MIGAIVQTGIGIDCEGETFRAVCVRRQWSRLRVVDRMEIPEYRKLDAAECGRRYRTFLRKHGLKAPQTVVALPRSAALLRALTLPQTVEKELGRAVEYQLDSLHPFEEGSVYWDYAVWKWPEPGVWDKLAANPAESGGARLETILGIAERKAVDALAAWFEEAGIPVSQFGVSAALWIAAFWPRLKAAFPDAPALLLLSARSERAEIIGFGPGRELVWQEVAVETNETADDFWKEVQQKLELTRSALRVLPPVLPDEQLPLVVCGSRAGEASARAAENLPFQIVPAEQLLPVGASGASGSAEGMDRTEGWMALTAALAAASPRSLLPLNLLPPEKRTYEPSLVRLPTYALASLVVLLAVAGAIRGPLQDRLYSRHLERELEALQPRLQQLETTQAGTETARERVQLLAGVRQSVTLPLEILNELTRVLPQEVWLQQLVYEGDTVTLNGFAPAASGLLQTLAASPYFENPQFRSSIGRTPDGQETFAISVRLRARVLEGLPR
jgi:Tfp pilus assembly protein PilN/Tfp pilus assembly PilM family ATPase